ncbi:MAG: hypothetical protein Q7R96_02195 [Nanoarchaeota archaeon]|nr:hypothetical protein [Nanoarchaeota archaeon]
MATPLNTDLLNFFVPIFIFLLVFIASYAFLLKVKLLGDNKGLLALASFVIAMIFVMYPAGRALIMIGTPWVIFFLALVVGIVTFFLFFGVKPESVAETMGGTTMITIVISVFMIIFLVVMTKVYGPFLMVDGAPTFWGAVKRTMFSSRVLGAILLLAIASFVVRWLPGKQ